MRIALKKQNGLHGQNMNMNPDPVITYDHISENEANEYRNKSTTNANTGKAAFILEESLLAALAVICYMTCI